MPTAKLKKSIAFAALIAIVVSIISLAAISSEELQGAVRKKVTKTSNTTATTNTNQTATVSPNITPTVGVGNGTPSATLQAYGYVSPNNNTVYPKRGYNAGCEYWTEIAKWKLTVNNAPLRLLRLPLYIRSLSSSNVNNNRIATQYRLYVSRNANNNDPIATYTATSTNNFFMFELTGNATAAPGALLQPGANYLTMEALVDPVPGAIDTVIHEQTNIASTITEVTNINNQIQTLNGTWGNFEGGNNATLQKGTNLSAEAPDTQVMVVIRSEHGNDLCEAVTPGPGGAVGNAILRDVYIGGGLPLNVSSACPSISNWEVLGKWSLSLFANDLKLKQFKFRVHRQMAESLDRVVSHEYRVVVSTDATNYNGTAVSEATVSNINAEGFTVTLPGGGVSLEDDWTQITGKPYYVTLEGKPYEHATSSESTQTLRSYISLDPAFSWGTFGEGKSWAHEATINNEAIIDTPGGFHYTIGGESWLGGGFRTLNQTDAEHPVASCVGASDPGTEFTFTQNIKEVQISGCNNASTDWVAVFQGTIETGYQPFALDGIPTVMREIGATGMGGNEVNQVKLVISSTADYASSQIASYEMDPASSWFLMATPGLTLQPQTTYYATYLIQPNSNTVIAAGTNNRMVQTGWMNNSIAVSKLGNAVIGHFSPSNTNLEARMAAPNMNIMLTPNTSYQANNQAGKFWLTACQ